MNALTAVERRLLGPMVERLFIGGRNTSAQLEYMGAEATTFTVCARAYSACGATVSLIAALVIFTVPDRFDFVAYSLWLVALLFAAFSAFRLTTASAAKRRWRVSQGLQAETHHLRELSHRATRVVLVLVVAFCLWSVLYAVVAGARGDWRDAATNLGWTTVVVLLLVVMASSRKALGHNRDRSRT